MIEKVSKFLEWNYFRNYNLHNITVNNRKVVCTKNNLHITCLCLKFTDLKQVSEFRKLEGTSGARIPIYFYHFSG
jgi:hypothetical protein